MSQQAQKGPDDDFDMGLTSQAINKVNQVYNRLRGVCDQLGMDVAFLEAIANMPWKASAAEGLQALRSVIDSYEDKHKPEELQDVVAHGESLSNFIIYPEQGIIASLLIENAPGWSQAAKIAYIMNFCKRSESCLKTDHSELVAVAKAEFVCQLLVAAELMSLSISDNQKKIISLIIEWQLQDLYTAFQKDLNQVEGFIYEIATKCPEAGRIISDCIQIVSLQKEELDEDEPGLHFDDYLEQELAPLLSDDSSASLEELSTKIVSDSDELRMKFIQALDLSNICKGIKESSDWNLPFEAVQEMIASEGSSALIRTDVNFRDLNSKRSQMVLESLIKGLNRCNKKLVIPYSELSYLANSSPDFLKELGESLQLYIKTGRRTLVLNSAPNNEHKERLNATMDVLDIFIEHIGKDRIVLTADPKSLLAAEKEGSNICVFGDQKADINYININILTRAREANYDFAHTLFQCADHYLKQHPEQFPLHDAAHGATKFSTIPILAESEKDSGKRFVGFRLSEIVEMLSKYQRFGFDEH